MSEQKKPKIKGFVRLLKALQVEQSWFQFYTEIARGPPEQLKVCQTRIKDLKKQLNFK